MKSKTKYKITDDEIKQIFRQAQLGEAIDIAPLGAGEYNAVFSVTAGGVEYAVKIAPPPDIPVLTYEKDMLSSELFWYEQLRQHTSIHVPKIYYRDFSKKTIPADFFIMEKLAGKQLNEMDFTKDEKAFSSGVVAKMAAQIHRVKNDKFGYIQNGLYDNWYLAIHAMVKALIDDCSAKGKRTRRGEKLLKMIEKYSDVLKKAECTMVNFDLGPANIICKRENSVVEYSWIDPERTLWGDKIADFVCLEIMVPFTKKEKSLNAYNSVSDAAITTGEEEKIRYAVAEAYMALIMETEKYYRYTPLHFGWWRNVAVCVALYTEAFKILK